MRAIQFPGFLNTTDKRKPDYQLCLLVDASLP